MEIQYVIKGKGIKVKTLKPVIKNSYSKKKDKNIDGYGYLVTEYKYTITHKIITVLLTIGVRKEYKIGSQI